MNRLDTHRPAERGQALILIILAIVGIFGFAALAVDLGQLYSARRASQSAADAAAMAAAFDAVAGSMDPVTAVDKALEMANNNGYNNDQVTNWVTVNNPPVDGPYCGMCGDPRANEYYQVRITVQVNPIFSQFIFGGQQMTTVEAIAHASDIASVTGGDALVSLSTSSDSLIYDGKTGVNISGGNIRSYGGMVKNGASGAIEVTPGKVYYSTSFSGHTSPFIYAKPAKNTTGQILNFTEPYCPTAETVKDGTWTKSGTMYKKTIDGVKYFYYTDGLSVENLPSGVHCIQGGIGKGNYTGTRVLIVLLSGGISQTGGDSLNFKAPLDIVDPNGNHFGGLLLYAPSTNKSVFKIGGNADAYVQGTIYAPGMDCTIGGTPSGVAYHTAIVCNTVTIHGNPILKIKYKAEELFRLPPSVEMVQ